MKKNFYSRVLQISLLLISILPVSASAMPNQSYYHRSADRLFWFMVISDVHIGANGSQDTDYLTWAVNDAHNIINPQFIVATGDLTNATNGGFIPLGQFSEEWEAYRQILDAAGMHAGIYYDIPGNHDHYDDEFFDYYRAYSIQGSASNTTQHSWTRIFSYGKYHFLGIATAGNDGAEFSIWPWDDFGDHAELTPGEIAFLESALIANSDAEIIFMFGHHPFEADASDWTETAITDGLEELQDLIGHYGVSLYGYGHTHDYMEDIWTQDIVNEIYYINTDSLGKSNEDHYTVMAVDGNGVSMVPAAKGLWPVVLITAPADRFLWQPPEEVFNPYAYEIPPAGPTPFGPWCLILIRSVGFNFKSTVRPAGRTCSRLVRHLSGSGTGMPPGHLPARIRSRCRPRRPTPSSTRFKPISTQRFVWPIITMTGILTGLISGPF